MTRIVCLAALLAALCYVTQAFPVVSESIEDVESELSLSDIHDETSEADKEIEEDLDSTFVELEEKITELTSDPREKIKSDNYFLDGLKKNLEKWMRNVTKIRNDIEELWKKPEKFVKDLLKKIGDPFKNFFPKEIST